MIKPVRATADILQAKYNPEQNHLALFEIDTEALAANEADLISKLVERGATNPNIVVAGPRAYGVLFGIPQVTGESADALLQRKYDLLKSLADIREEATYFPGIRKLVYDAPDGTTYDLFLGLEEPYLQRQWFDLIDASNDRLNDQ